MLTVEKLLTVVSRSDGHVAQLWNQEQSWCK